MTICPELDKSEWIWDMYTGPLCIPEVFLCFLKSHSDLAKKIGSTLIPHLYLKKYEAPSEKVEGFFRATRLVVAEVGPESSPLDWSASPGQRFPQRYRPRSHTIWTLVQSGRNQDHQEPLVSYGLCFVTKWIRKMSASTFLTFRIVDEVLNMWDRNVILKCVVEETRQRPRFTPEVGHFKTVPHKRSERNLNPCVLDWN